MSNAILDVSSYWNKGSPDTDQAFTKQSEALDHIYEYLKELPSMYSDWRSMVRKILQFIKDKHFNRVGKKVTIQGKRCDIVAALPQGTFLVLAECLPFLKDRVHARNGATCTPASLEKTRITKDITGYWRKDNMLRRGETFKTVNDAVSYIRKSSGELRVSVRVADKGFFAFIENTCLAIEHDYFRLIGNTIRTNERKPDAERGPLPTSGKLTAVLPEGRGLVLSNKATNGSRYGFIVGRKRMAQIIRDIQKKKRK